jgi:hypothetical protein
MLYFSPLFFSKRCTCAISADTLAVGVPRGMRQKSAVQDGGVARDVRLVSLLLLLILW